MGFLAPDMHGTGAPVVTPFESDGSIAIDDLQTVAKWLVDNGADFLVPCGSSGEAPLLSVEERTLVVETVADAVSVPVVSGTGHPGFRETLGQTRRDAEAGADAALVVTPFYYGHDDREFAAYYRDLADESPIPIYLYSVPKFTDVQLAPRTVEQLAVQDGIAGMKDSSGDFEALQRERRLAPDFDLFVGSGSLYAAGLDVGADGAILAMANVVPDLASEIYDRHQAGDDEGARELNRSLVELNRAVTGRYGVPGLKAAMAVRDVPAGTVRRPNTPVSKSVRRELRELVDAVV